MGCICSRSQAESGHDETASLLPSDTSSLRPESTSQSSGRVEESTSTGTGATTQAAVDGSRSEPNATAGSPPSSSKARQRPLSLIDLPDELIEYICYFLDRDMWNRHLSLRHLSLVRSRCRGPAQARWRPFRRIRLCLTSSACLTTTSQTLWGAVRNHPSPSPVQRLEIKEGYLHAPFSPQLLASIADRCGYTLKELVLSRLSEVNLQQLSQLPGLTYLALRSCKFHYGVVTLSTIRRLEINAQTVLDLPECHLPLLEDLVFFDHREFKEGLAENSKFEYLLTNIADTLRRLYLHPIEREAFEEVVLRWLPTCRNISLIKLFVEYGTDPRDESDLINALPAHIAPAGVHNLSPSEDDTDGLTFKFIEFDTLLVIANQLAPATPFYGENHSGPKRSCFRFASDLCIHSDKIDRSSGPRMRQRL
ncbi:hypothetical protein MVLG_04048 [Microbotryum lychnidis-dioicae p1A1 Lamole]|uniref:Uncharacterized protein n=1 Tax=Microbotryum lychnidis-dioicae (strain p1A1 Lamole / MvSl-1064) TaxID=683840 RepID=U5HA11_USTV1|nr:hypothetical protein MVLG_04048 [Microbotryum lychnidis-dioicae p1A1 Lamole]|eukprot:KDE05551.1 hypothetical protein MVLG_04048 [Microbotryum lychnidis-dioicae p1A1 Lamole]